MRAAAALLVGEHDFRNLCKLDAAKQLTSFRRRVLRAEISAVPALSGTGEEEEEEEEEGGVPAQEMLVLDLVGSAFLYHQVRHIMAVLFLVGTGREGRRSSRRC